MNNVHNMETKMFKALFTLARGATARAEEEVADRNALLILDQQIRDVAASFARAKQSLALAIAQEKQEASRLRLIDADIADLETRVSAALDANDEERARIGAEAIANLENDRDASARALETFAKETQRLRAYIDQASARIADLERGRKLANAAEATRRLRRGRIEPEGLARSTLSEAEATLTRLRSKQQEAIAAEDALDDIEKKIAPQNAAEKLSEAGYGPKLKSTADDVLNRIKQKKG
jgi:phage shock protein A